MEIHKRTRLVLLRKPADRMVLSPNNSASPSEMMWLIAEIEMVLTKLEELIDRILVTRKEPTDKLRLKSRRSHQGYHTPIKHVCCYDEAARLDPKSVYAWNGKGNLLYKLDKYSDALEYYGKAPR
jgi:tetratricopeptide (TPR) repeat protein